MLGTRAARLALPLISDYRVGMNYMPPLDDPSKRVLRVIQSLGVAPGWQVMKEAPVTAEELTKAAHALVGSGLIKASGNLSNVAEIGKAYFNIQPSNARYVDYVLNLNA
jgi:hypothetical protein